MDDTRARTLVNAVLYILQRTGGTDRYHLLKILYFAEKSHLAKWGQRLLGVDFQAWEYGPVQVDIYHAITSSDHPANDFERLLAESIRFAGLDARDFILPNSEPDMDYLSPVMKESLDEAIATVGNMSFSALKNLSHDPAWGEAHRQGRNNVISPLSMAKSANADDDMLAYIKEMLAIEEALK